MKNAAAFLIDGGIAYLGLPSSRGGARTADLRKPLCLARELARGDHAFRCYFDRNLPYRVREEDRALLDLLVSEHSEAFSVIPRGVAAEEYLLQRAAASGATVISAVPLAADPNLLDRYAWLSDPGRCLVAGEENGQISCPPLADASHATLTAFDLYDDLLIALPRP